MTRPVDDPFVDPSGEARVVRGVTLATTSQRLAELAGVVGFDTVWIDVEHGTVGFESVERLCIAAKAGGATPTVRIPGNDRENILRALEAGGRIIVVPMINSAEDARAIVEHGKYPPVGQRGFYSRSRGVDYGLAPVADLFQTANRRTHFFAQIETLEAVENAEAICDVPGLAGVFVGPGDLSVSMGKPAAFTDPQLIETVEGVVRLARSKGLHAGILAPPGALLGAAREAGADLLFVGNDVTCVAQAWGELLKAVT